MDSSTIVARTAAGNAELAAAAHGLSLTQRRFLTLLDTACTLDALALRHPVAPGKIERDVARLAQLGLVTGPTPVAANSDLPPAATVRLGAPVRARRPYYALLSLVAAALVWAGWQHLAPPLAPDAQGAPSRVAARVPVPMSVDPAPIAIRVLRADPGDRVPASTREPRPWSAAAKNTEPRIVESAGTKAHPALPVEHRSPAPDDSAAAPRPGNADAHPERALPSSASESDPVVASTPNVAEPATPRPASAPAPVPVPAVASMPVPAPAAVEPTTQPLDARASGAMPIQVASAAPATGLLRRAAAPALVPISREPPDFPREAITAGIASGSVRARLTVDAQGNVSNVEIVEASHRAFDRVVQSALARWRFEPGAPGRTTAVDVTFKRD